MKFMSRSRKAPWHLWRMALLLACCAAGLSTARAAGVVMTPDVDVTSGIDMEIESWFEDCPQAGMAPVEWRIVNRSAAAHTWHLEMVSGDGYGSAAVLQSNYSMTVAAGSSGVMSLYVPLPSIGSGRYSNRPLIWKVSGPGVRGGGSLGSLGNYSSGTEFVALSKEALGKTGWGDLKSHLDKSSRELIGSPVDMTRAPEDWRGYSGMAQLWLTDSEWLAMSELSRLAVMDWLTMGGRLFVLTQDAGERELAGLKLAAPDTASFHGAGRVKRLVWNGRELPVADAAGEMVKPHQNLRKALGDYHASWKLRDRMGDLRVNAPLIFCFIALFGILVGPVNLFVLAKPGKRSRLFWTTPVISLGGSLLLMGLMVIQDGFGGSGLRQVLVLLQPEQKRMAVIQEQVSLTGILNGRSFEKKEPDMMVPLRIDDQHYYSSNPDRYVETPHGRSGQWFSSRSVQAHLLQTVRPTRAAVEFFSMDGQEPEILSSVDAVLETVFVRDDQGELWKTENLGTGERKTLSKATGKEWQEWTKTELRAESGPVMDEAVAGVLEQRGYVYAVSKTASSLAVSSLDAIKWDQEKLIVAGPYVKP